MAQKDNTGKILGLIALVGGGYFIYKKFIEKPAANTTGLTSYYPIVYQKFAPDVKEIQSALGVTQDGIIGPQTLAALQPYWPATTAFKIDNRAQLDYVLGTIRAGKATGILNITSAGGGLTVAADVMDSSNYGSGAGYITQPGDTDGKLIVDDYNSLALAGASKADTLEVDAY